MNIFLQLVPVLKVQELAVEVEMKIQNEGEYHRQNRQQKAHLLVMKHSQRFHAL